MVAIKHLIECNCILPQFMMRPDPPFHRFIVFSEFKEGVDPLAEKEDVLQEKLVQCENCAAVHRVYDICKSEIMAGQEVLNTALSLDDLKCTLPPRLVTLLEKHAVSFYKWEEAKWLIDNEMWGESIVLSSDEIDGKRHLKRLRINGLEKFSIDVEAQDSVLAASV